LARCAIVLFAALAALVANAAHADFRGRVVAVHDGDTISVRVGQRPVRVRLAGVDAPERGQPFANASRHALEALVAAKEVQVVERGRDGYGRVLGVVIVGVIDANAEQVRTGYAWVYRRFERDARLLALEAEARAARRGLWRDPNAVPPWRWRERQRLQPARLRVNEPA
jgi:endonuclease YncB( thermonuclease family)